jgi:hypothetical protein
MKLVCKNRLFDTCTNIVSLVIILLCITVPVILGSLDLTTLFVISVILGIIGFIIAIAIFCGEFDDCFDHIKLQKLLAKCGLVSSDTIFYALKANDVLTFSNRFYDGLSDIPATKNYITYKIEAIGQHYCRVSKYKSVDQSTTVINYTRNEFMRDIGFDYHQFNSVLLNDLVICTCL